MKALAELELREHAHHSAHKEKAEQQAALFELFRKTMAREITDIHALQDDMHKKHTAAFKRLALELVQTATDLKNYTDNGLGDVNGRVTALSAKQEEDSQRVLVTLAQRVAAVHAKIGELHTESMRRINATEAYAEGVEAAMRDGDAQLLSQIEGLDTDLSSLDRREGSHFVNLTAGLAAAAAQQQRDRDELIAKINGDVSSLRENASSALSAEKVEIRQKLGDGLGAIRESIEEMRRNITERAGALTDELQRVEAEQGANNGEQAREIAALRGDFNEANATAFGRLQAADSRISAAFGALNAAEARLRSEAEADKAMLLDHLEGNVTALREERERLEAWAEDTVTELNASVLATQRNLSASRAFLEAQRAADMRELTDKIIHDVTAANGSLHSRLSEDWAGLDERITHGLEHANERISSANASAWAQHAAMTARVQSMEQRSADVDARQDAILAQLQRDAALEKALVEARAAALQGNVTAAKQRLEGLSGEVHRVQTQDREDIRSRVSSGISGLDARLTGEVDSSKQALEHQIQAGLGDLHSRLSYLQGSSEAEYSSMSRQVSDLTQHQRAKDREERAAIYELNATQADDERRVRAGMAAVTAALRAAEGRLGAALSEVAAERASDLEGMRGRISGEVEGAEQRLKGQVEQAEAALSAELQSAISRLGVAMRELRARTAEDYEGLRQNVSALAAAQGAEDDRQHAWLERLRQSASDTAEATAERISVLEEEMNQADVRQTAAATALERLQAATARDVNSTLHDAVAALRSRILGELAANKNAISAAMEGGFGRLRHRVLTLGAAANASATAIQEAVAALGQRCHAKHHRRRSEMQRIEEEAETAESSFNARMDALEHLLQQGQVALAAKVSEAQASQATAKSAMEAYVDHRLELVRSNASTVLARSEGGLRTDLAAEVQKWTNALAKLAGDSGREAEAIRGEIARAATDGEDQHEAVMGAVQRLVAAVAESKATSDAAVAALRLGLHRTKARLNTTAAEVSGEAAAAAADTRARIASGLAALRANFSSSMAKQQEEARAALAARAEAVEENVAKLQGEMREGVGELNRSVVALRTKERDASRRHSAEIARMLQTHTTAIQALQDSVSALKEALVAAEGRLGAQSGELRSQMQMSLAELHAKLQRAVERLQAATSDVSDQASQKLVVAEGKLSAAKAEVDATADELKRRHDADTNEVKEQIAAGLRELEGRVRATIASSLASIRAELGGQMAALRTKIAEAKGSVESTEQALQGKMSDLTATEATNSAEQDRQIAALVAKQQQLKTLAAARGQGISTNLSMVERSLRGDYAELDRARREDKATLLARIADSMTSAKDTLLAELSRVKRLMSEGLMASVNAANGRVTEERSAVEAAIREMDDRLRALQAASSSPRASADVADLEARIAALRSEVQRNNTGLSLAMQQLASQLRAEQQQGRVQQRADVESYRRAAAEEAAGLRTNYSRQLRQERDDLLAQVHQLVDGLSDAVRAGVTGPQVTLGELKETLSALKRDVREEYAERRREIRAINSTSLSWVNSMSNKIQTLTRKLERARQNQLRGNRDSRRNINTLKSQLRSLASAARSVGNVEADLHAMRARVDTVRTGAETAYGSAQTEASSIQGRARELREDLEAAVARLDADIASEASVRQRGFSNTTAQLGGLRARVEWIEEELRRLRLVVNRTYTLGPEEQEQEEHTADEFAPPDHAAPPYEPPPIPEGHTPPPFPLLFWDYRTQQGGLDTAYADMGAGVRLGATTVGSLTGSIGLPASGRWSCYLVLHAAENGDGEDEVKVTINGIDVGTFNNVHSSGYPCGSRSCLNSRGLYVPSAEFEGGSVEYSITWTSSNNDPERHMTVGVGEAAFLGTGPAPASSSGSYKVEVTAQSAVDAKTVKTNTITSDGFERRGFNIPQNARLVVLDGANVVGEATMANGKASIMVPEEGLFACVVTLPGYFHYFDPECSSKRREKNYALLSPVLPPGMSRFVLQWGARPSDLDVYLLSPHQDPNSPACEVNYRRKQCHSGSVHLDKDDVNGHGPETITIQRFNPGQYVLRIDEYRGNPNRPSWDISHALVTYYAPHLGAVQYSVAQNGFTDGDVWYVMAVDGTTRNPTECTREICEVRARP